MRRISAVFLACVAGCGGGSSHPCDPLAAAGEGPIALATLVGAGSHPDGTVYLLDRAGSEHRAFVGNGSEVWRKRVAGSAEFDGAVAVLVTEAEPPFHMKVETTDSGTTRMGVLRGPMAAGRDFVIGQDGDLLTPLPLADVQALRLHNLGGDVFVEYASTLDDGRHLVVVRPLDDWSYEDFRLFLGPPEQVAELKVDSVQRSRDGGTTTIHFRIGRASAQASFVFQAGGRNTVGVLEYDGHRYTLSWTSGSAPAGLHYVCR